MEATLGISLYSYLYPKLAKTLYLSYYLSFFQQNQRTRRLSRFFPEVEGGGGGAQAMYTHVSKCKIIKLRKKT
jgi:hypothetical protein